LVSEHRVFFFDLLPAGKFRIKISVSHLKGRSLACISRQDYINDFLIRLWRSVPHGSKKASGHVNNISGF
jgi:hypothetical protein